MAWHGMAKFHVASFYTLQEYCWGSLHYPCKSGPVADNTVHRNRAVMGCQNFLHNRQTESGPSCLRCIKWVKKTRTLLWRYPGARVTHGDLQVRGRSLPFAGKRTALRHGFDGVLEKLDQRPLKVLLMQRSTRFNTRHGRSTYGAVINQAIRDLLARMTLRQALVEVPDFLAGSIAVSGDFWHFGRTPTVVGSTPG